MQPVKCTPIRNQVLVKPYPSEEKTLSGIYVPENAREVNNKVLVIAAGNGLPNKPMQFKAGQTAYRTKGWGVEIELNGEQHFLMDAQALLALE